jgi:DNA-directed RNA polymerase specialized sigma24 family protein
MAANSGAGAGHLSAERTREPAAGFLPLLDSDPALAERKYRMMRAKLVFYFLQHRCLDPEDLADEVVLRAHRRYMEGIEITSEFMSFCYGIASRVCMEQRAPAVEFDEALHSPSSGNIAVGRDRLILVEQCLRRLDTSDCAFIREYFEDDRRELAERLGKSPNALRIRAFRIVETLRDLVGKRTPRRADTKAPDQT